MLAKYATQTIAAVLAHFGTQPEGLSEYEARQRLRKVGYNEISQKEEAWWHLVIRQINCSFTYLLLGASGIAYFVTQDSLEATIIMIIVLINTALGFFQEYRASRALQYLKSFIVSKTHVLRANTVITVLTRELVPGDIILLEAGDIIPADVRIIESHGFQVDESALTGETIAVAKSSAPMAQEPEHPYQATNMCFASTTVLSGSAHAVIVATGSEMVVGSIAQLLSESKRESLFAKNINAFSRFIAWMVVIASILTIGMHVIVRGAPLFDPEYWIYVLALAVIIVPELLPTVVALSLSQGAMELARRKVIVKRLTAIEDLGSIDILCTDKTGTLTENKLTLVETYEIEKQLLKYACLFANHTCEGRSAQGQSSNASPFDDAIMAYTDDDAQKYACSYRPSLFVPFEPERRRSSAVFHNPTNNTYLLVVWGGHEELLKHSNNISESQADEMQKFVMRQGEQGRRVIGIAIRHLTAEPSDVRTAEENLTFAGLLSFVDPIKASTYTAIKGAQELGLKIKILTGDSPEVAGYVGVQIGLCQSIGQVMMGDVFAKLGDTEKLDAVKRFAIFARVSPHQKYEIIKLLQSQGFHVGFMGDGINDAPALHAAHVAMVVDGATDIAREAADIVLLKKSLCVIIDGIHYGRTIFANTVKYIKVSLAGSFGNFYAMSIISLFVDYLPILPIQILLLNILSDIPLLALSTDYVEPAELKEPKQYSLRDIAMFTTGMGLFSSLFDFSLFLWFRQFGVEILRTCWFVGSILSEAIFLMVVRSRKPIWRAVGPSRALLIPLILSLTLTLALPSMGWGQRFFKFVPLNWQLLQYFVIFGAVYFVAIEVAKRMYYRFVIGDAARNDEHKKSAQGTDS